jgi:hypothetical protein
MDEKPGRMGEFVSCIVLGAAWVALGLKWIEIIQAHPTYSWVAFAVYTVILMAASVWFVRKLLQ